MLVNRTMYAGSELNFFSQIWKLCNVVYQKSSAPKDLISDTETTTSLLDRN